jgi:hypothetical protein
MVSAYQMESKSGFSKPFIALIHKVVGLDWQLVEELLKHIRAVSESSLPSMEDHVLPLYYLFHDWGLLAS